MKVRLNLYTHRFRPRRLLLDRRLLVGILGLTILLSGIGGAWLQRVNVELSAEHRRSSQRQAEQEARMLALSTRLSGRSENQTLLQDIAEHTRVVAGKRHLLAQLTERLSLADARFSRYLQGLSESHVQGLWLTRVRAQGGDLILDGRSLSEQLLPQWIQQLSSQTDFRGKRFGLLELSRSTDSEQAPLDFHLSTRLQRDEQGDG